LDNIIRDNGKGTCLVINIPISRDGTVIQKDGEIILKYEDLPTEIRSMWNVKTEVIQVITGAQNV